MSKRSGFNPCPIVDTAGQQVVPQAGGLLLTETIAVVGLDRALSAALARWRPVGAVHDPAKVLLDLAVTLALGGDCLADIAVIRAAVRGFRRPPGAGRGGARSRAGGPGSPSGLRRWRQRPARGVGNRACRLGW